MILKKRIILFYTLLLLFTVDGLSQNNDTISLISIQNNPTIYLSPMEHAFMFHEDTPWMIKAGFSSHHSSFIGFERRIKGGFTANFSIENILNIQDISFWNLSTRYYYNMKHRNKNKETPFNLSGNYFAIGVGVNRTNWRNTEIVNNTIQYSEETSYDQNYFLKWGIQRRYLKNGFVDLGLKFTYFKNNNYSSFSFNSESILGFAFAKDKRNLEKDKLCAVIKCFEEERSSLRLNISNLFSFVFNRRNKWFNLTPEISYEKKIGETSFSINNLLNLQFGYSYLPDYDFNQNPQRGVVYFTPKSTFTYGLEYTLSTRYYYNLKQRMLKGKTGNGLSANYVSLGIFNNYNRNGENLSNGKFEANENYGFIQPQIATGFQRFVGDHFYYDIVLGYRPNAIRFKESEYNNFDQFFLNYKIGYRF